MTIQNKLDNISDNFLNSKSDLNISNISTGFPELDKAINETGIPSKSIIEIFGEKATGKTILSYNLIANAQKVNKLCVYVNSQYSFDKNLAKKIGINIDELLVINNNEADEVFVLLTELIEKEQVGLIVFDSITALNVRTNNVNIINNSIYNIIYSNIKILIQYIVAKSVVLVFTSQIREQIGKFRHIDTFHKVFVSCASIRMEIKRKETVREKGQVIGIKSQITMLKNRFKTISKEPIEIELKF